jgi:dienelactone hydrolase
VYLPSGFGLLFDAVFVISATVIVGGALAIIVALLLTAMRRLPRVIAGSLVGASVVMTLGWFSTPSISLVGATTSLCVAATLLGATIAALTSDRFHSSTRPRKALTLLLLVVAGVYSIGFVSTLARDGDLENISSWRPQTSSMPALLSATNPGAMGPYRVKTLFYGPGTDIRRPEYSSTVGIRTRTVDASAFFKRFSGWSRWVRSRFWGFDVDKLPLNARVWYPDGPGPFPLALIAHGNHRMNDFSDPGYQYLGELLASRGFILASVDENFLNGTPGLREPTAAELPRSQEHAVRGWLLLEHLRLWHEWNHDPASTFFGKVDVGRIALMGHSRGGEAAATAAMFNRMKYYPEDAAIRFDYDYAIKSIVAIAPSDRQYDPAGQPRWIEDVSYLTLQGAHDADSSSFAGSRQASYVPLATFQEDANLSSTTAKDGVITGENLTIWREGRIPTRRGDRNYNGVFLGWRRAEGRTPPEYTISLPRDGAQVWRLNDKSTVELSIAALDQDAPFPSGAAREQQSAGRHREAPDFTIELIASDGRAVEALVHRFADIPPPLKETFTKFDFVEGDRYGRDWEPVFQTIRAPLAAFTSTSGPTFDPQKLVAVRLKFDRTATSVVCISGIGFGSE